MKEQILKLIDHKKYSEAYERAKSQENLASIYGVWTQIYEGAAYEDIERKINLDHFATEIIESIQLYIHLSESDWDNSLLSEFRRVAKMLIAETTSELRNATHSEFNGQIMHNDNFHDDPQVRNYLQDLIEHFDKKELYESKADIARVKAQFTLTLNLEKRFVGADMIQYGKSYEAVKQFEESTQIYFAVIHDFEDALHITYEDKNEQLLELDFLKQAYEGVLRLTNNPEMHEKLKHLNAVVSKIVSPLDSNRNIQAPAENQFIEKRSWFKRLLECVK